MATGEKAILYILHHKVHVYGLIIKKLSQKLKAYTIARNLSVGPLNSSTCNIIKDIYRCYMQRGRTKHAQNIYIIDVLH